MSNESPKEAGPQLLGQALILLAAAGFGSLAIFAKYAYAEGFGVAWLLALRFLVAAGVSWLVAFRQGIPPRYPLITLIGLLALGVLYVGNASLFFLALERIPASWASLLFYTYPALVTMVAVLRLRESLSTTRWIALVAAMLGTALVVSARGEVRLSEVGVAMALGAALVFSLYVILGGQWMAGLRADIASAWVMSASAAVFLLISLIGGQVTLTVSPRAWALVVGMAVIGTAMPIQAFLAGLKRIGASRAAVVSTFEPVVTVALAATLLGETLAPTQALGGALILSAVFLLARERVPAEWQVQPRTVISPE
ncbi:MAG: EamA family transporter [Chloroflexi bacterium]|nr:EamA family transporter [Chloroflexota bacterium]